MDKNNNIITFDFTEVYNSFNNFLNEPFDGTMKPKKGSILKRFMNIFKK